MRSLILCSMLMFAAPASAEVVASSATGFELRYTKQVEGDPAAALRRFAQVAKWWSPDHTYSGNADNLSLDLKAGGCFCEALPGGGGVEHMRVSALMPGERLVLSGGLGPLLYEATAGVMDVTFKPAGSGSEMSVTYRAAGFAKGGAEKMAPLVDKVLGEQINRFAAYTG